MKTISSRHHHPKFDRKLSPALTVTPGEEVVFETLDACYGEVRSLEDFRSYRQQPPRGGDPVTGPVYIEGASPGNTLVVDILNIEPVSLGFQLIGPDRGIIEKEIPEWTHYQVTAAGNRIRLSNGLDFAAEPIIGCFGNAPSGSPTDLANPLGGNCDVPAVRTGCSLYIPIEVPGALFSLGDVHARQGDGEVVGAPEIGARVTARLDVKPGRHSEWFMIEDEVCWYTVASADTEAQAAQKAVFYNAHFIEREYDVAFEDALIVLTMIGTLSIARTGRWGHHHPVVCSGFSKLELREALIHYSRHPV